MSKGGGARWVGDAPNNEDERLARDRGYLEQELVRLWNNCARASCGHDYKYHVEDGWGMACSAFVPNEARPYLRKIASWEYGQANRAREHHQKAPRALDVTPEGVIIPLFERKPSTETDQQIAKMLRFDFEAEGVVASGR